ncbi:DUF2249 domain-containing protein [Pseudoxanthomonas suwonensis]|uniref:DUF2249 domain-containing protein n=1 Tax=Pseudoxanthomonas suwonensis TaxID=314722 RepID=UPI00138F3383|nr:DUF2249 domain-containing protein [Pseudoxanthomonas suwonensis]KAF1700448.1 hypothetical protein CSC68_11695 [Pseudoxanthomonas suwonensis]
MTRVKTPRRRGDTRTRLMYVNASRRPRCERAAARTRPPIAMSPLLDLRHLPPPEPLQHILEALDALPARAVLVALTPFRPVPLLPMLEAQGSAWRLADLPEGGCRIAIWRRPRTGSASTSAPAPGAATARA